MSTTYAAFISYLREDRKLTQAEVAAAALMSRASYVAVEKGTKELTLAEADAITKLFGITIDELLRTEAPNLLKYRQMMLAFLRLAKTDRVALKKTKLAQLLYLADFSWYYTARKSLSGVSYRHTDFGPLADVYFRLLEEMEAGGVVNIKQIYRDDYHMYEIEETRTSTKKQLSELSKKELAHLETIWTQWRDASTAEIVAFTSEQAPYRDSVVGEIIQYTSILTVEAFALY